jgi:hypothetical protein
MMTTRPTPAGRLKEWRGASWPTPLVRPAPNRNARSAIVISLGALALAGLIASLLANQRSTRPPYRLAEESDVTEAMFV